MTPRRQVGREEPSPRRAGAQREHATRSSTLSCSSVWGCRSLQLAHGSEPRTLSLFDLGTEESMRMVDVPGIAPDAMAVRPTSVWVLDYHGAPTLIDII